MNQNFPISDQKATRRTAVKASAAAMMAASLPISQAVRVSAQDSERLTAAYKSDAQTMDPYLTTDTTTQTIHFQLFETLVKMGRDGQFEGMLAESWESIDDVTWRFNLRQDVSFHNGEAFNADSVVFSLERMRKPELNSPAAPGLEAIERFEKVDDFTVDAITVTPFSALLSVLYSELKILPPGYIGEVGDDAFNDSPIGTGPFKFVEWIKDVELVLESNPDHWRAEPEIKQLIFRPIPEDSSRIAALQNGEVDWIAAVNVDRVSDLETNDQLTIQSRPGQAIYAQLDTIDTQPFMNQEVRQAVNHAVNVQSIIDDLLDGRATRLPSVLFSSTPGFDPEKAPYEYDLDRAAELLDSAGYSDGFELTLTAAPGQQAAQKFDEVAQAIAQDLSQVGITVNLDIIDPAIIGDRYHNSELSFFIFPWGSSHESGRYLDTLLHSQRRGYYYQNEELDALIDEFMGSVDPEQKAETGSQINELAFEDAPWLFLYQEPDIYGLSNAVQWEPSAHDVYFHAFEASKS